MKRLIKSAMKAFWAATLPARTPLLDWFSETVARSIRPTEELLVAEARTLMEHVVRELVRLQRQVEDLELAVEALSTEQSGPATAEQLKAG